MPELSVKKTTCFLKIMKIKNMDFVNNKKSIHHY